MVSLIKLSQALNSHLCHEISGLIGSISTGVELYKSKDFNIRDKAQHILDTTPQELTNIISFYKIAYGFSLDDGNANLNEIEVLCKNFVKSKIQIHFSLDKNLILNKEIGKIILCLVMLLNKAILREGTINVVVKKVRKNCTINIGATGYHLKIDENKIAILQDLKDESDLNVHNSNEYYIYFLIKSLKLDITVKHNENNIEFLISD